MIHYYQTKFLGRGLGHIPLFDSLYRGIPLCLMFDICKVSHQVRSWEFASPRPMILSISLVAQDNWFECIRFLAFVWLPEAMDRFHKFPREFIQQKYFTDPSKINEEVLRWPVSYPCSWSGRDSVFRLVCVQQPVSCECEFKCETRKVSFEYHAWCHPKTHLPLKCQIGNQLQNHEIRSYWSPEVLVTGRQSK